MPLSSPQAHPDASTKHAPSRSFKLRRDERARQRATLATHIASVLAEIAPRPCWHARTAAVGIFSLLAAAVVYVGLDLSGVDVAISELFYDRVQYRWLLNHGDDDAYYIVLYTAPKVVVAVIGGVLAGALLGPAKWHPHLASRGIACVLAFSVYPVAVSGLKLVTDVYYPRQLARFQDPLTLPAPGQWQVPGETRISVPHRHLWQPFDPPRPPEMRAGRGFPAAHATTGFWLMGLAALARTRRWRLVWLAVGSLAGLVLGAYQVVNGNHFFSHALVSWGIGGAFLAAVVLLFDPWRQASRSAAKHHRV